MPVFLLQDNQRFADSIPANLPLCLRVVQPPCQRKSYPAAGAHAGSVRPALHTTHVQGKERGQGFLQVFTFFGRGGGESGTFGPWGEQSVEGHYLQINGIFWGGVANFLGGYSPSKTGFREALQAAAGRLAGVYSSCKVKAGLRFAGLLFVSCVLSHKTSWIV